MMIPAKYTARFVNGCAFKPSDWGDNGLPILRIAQLSGKEFDNYYDGEIDSRYLIKDGDLLFAWSATIDSYLWNRGNAVLNQHIFKVIPKSSINKKFLYYSLKHYSQIWADLDAHGSTTRHIKKESLGKKIFIPSYDEQKKIADFLDRETARINQLIEKKENFLERAMRRWEALLYENLTGQNLSYSRKDSNVRWIGTVPEHWDVWSVRYLTREHRQGYYTTESYTDDGLPLARITDLMPFGRVSFGNAPKVNNIPQTKEFLLKKGDFLFARTGGAGLFGVVKDEDIKAVYASYLIRFRLSEKCDHNFMKFYFLSRCFLDGVEESIHGGVNQNIHAENIKGQKVALPPVEEQKNICTILSTEQQRLEKIQSLTDYSIEKLKELRNSLITEAVTGKLDIKAWKKKGGTDKRLDNIKEAMFDDNLERGAAC